ncbi:MAG: hypothetical protein QMC67_04100 [Candidatus Wallbacteria bacterium]
MKKSNDIFIIKLVIIINFFSIFIAFGAGCQGNKVTDANIIKPVQANESAFSSK